MVRQKPKNAGRAGRGAGARLIGAAALLLALGATAAPASADPLLESLAGSWIGRGTYATSASAQPELVYCRITNTLVGGGDRLEQKGRCAVATNSSSVTGYLTTNGGGSYAGALDSISSVGPAKVSGTGNSGRLDLTADYVDRGSRKPGRAVISLVVSGGKYRLVSNPIGPSGEKHYPTTDIVFTPQ